VVDVAQDRDDRAARALIDHLTLAVLLGDDVFGAPRLFDNEFDVVLGHDLLGLLRGDTGVHGGGDALHEEFLDDLRGLDAGRGREVFDRERLGDAHLAADLGWRGGALNGAALLALLHLAPALTQEAAGSGEARLALDQILLTPGAATTLVGHDAASEAIDYALKTGLLDAGFSQNLEIEDPDENFTREVGETDLVITTGAVGYVSDKTFNRLADRFATRKPWVCCFVIRMFAFEPIRQCLDSHGYVTEKLEGRVFRQRRFKDEGERENVAKRIREWGLDPSPEMEDGFYHAECYLSRPKDDIDAPVAKLLGDV